METRYLLLCPISGMYPDFELAFIYFKRIIAVSTGYTTT